MAFLCCMCTWCSVYSIFLHVYLMLSLFFCFSIFLYFSIFLVYFSHKNVSTNYVVYSGFLNSLEQYGQNSNFDWILFNLIFSFLVVQHQSFTAELFLIKHYTVLAVAPLPCYLGFNKDIPNIQHCKKDQSFCFYLHIICSSDADLPFLPWWIKLFSF